MARNNPKPTEKPDWVPDDSTNIVVPSGSRKTSGWVFSVKPPAEHFNWFWNLISRFTDYFSAQTEEWIVIDSDADEGDYTTLAAYLADAPAAGDKILIKQDQTVTVQTIIPSDITLKFLDGAKLLCATNIATSVLKLGSNVIIEEILNIVLSHTGTTAKAVELDGDNATAEINIENSSTGILTTGYHINANNDGNKIEGFVDNTGGGTFTNIVVDNSLRKTNIFIIRDNINNDLVERLRGGFKNPKIWNFAQEFGIELNIVGINFSITKLTETDIAFADSANDELRTYRWSGTWALVGNALPIAGLSASPSLTRLNATDIAYIDGGNMDLRVYRFDGTDWAQVGNDLNIAGIVGPVIAALNGTDVAYIDSTNEDLRVYRFDGTDWAQVGNDLNIVGTGSATITAMNGTDIAFIETASNDLRLYRFDGTDWAQVGNDLNIPAFGSGSLAALNGDDVVLANNGDDVISIYRFDGTDWIKVGWDLAITGMGVPTITAMNGTDIAFIDGSLDDLRIYKWYYDLD